MPKTAAKFRLLAIVGFMLAAVCVPWVRAAPEVAGTLASVVSSCCCGVEGGPCCCAEQTDAGDSAESAASAPRCCACAEQPVDRGGPWLMLVMSGVSPMGWHPGPAVEAVAAPVAAIVPHCRIEARALPVPSMASRLARLGVRTT